MKKLWNVADATSRLEEVVDLALSGAPQHVIDDNGDTVVVVSAAEYTRLVGETASKDANADHPGIPFLEFMQRSPLAQAIREGDWPWEWDDLTRDWVERAR